MVNKNTVGVEDLLDGEVWELFQTSITKARLKLRAFERITVDDHLLRDHRPDRTYLKVGQIIEKHRTVGLAELIRLEKYTELQTY